MFCSDSLRGAAVEHTPREANVKLVRCCPCLALVAVFCLLAVASSASAEAQHQQAQAVEKLGLKITEDAPGGSFAATDADRDIRGQCLPDTEDPRGPKGK